MKQKHLDAAIWASLAIILWFAYPSAAFWVSGKLPYVHLLLVPGASPLLPLATAVLGSGVWLLRKHGALTPAVRIAAWILGSALVAWWVAVFGFWAFVSIRGGL